MAHPQTTAATTGPKRPTPGIVTPPAVLLALFVAATFAVTLGAAATMTYAAVLALLAAVAWLLARLRVIHAPRAANR